MSKRRLRPDELELWGKVAKTADPLQARASAPVISGAPTKKAETPRTAPATQPISKFKVGSKATAPSGWTPPQTTSDRLKADSLQMDAKAFGRLKRGKLVPEARIDLHGMTVDQAHPELIRFILTSQTRGFRLVLVITGKGQIEDPYDPFPRRRGVLRSQVPSWLRMAPVSHAILQVTEAHQRHGGGGAYYVYLRRNR